MKKIFRGFAAFLLMVSIAFAASAKTVDLSDYADGEGWKQFSQALVADGLMKPGSDRFQTVGVSNAMYNALDEAQQGSVSRVGFHSLNMVVNNLPAEMTVGEFRKYAGNLKLPDVKVVAVATTSAPPTTLVPAAAAPQVQTPPAPVVTVDNVQQQLEALNKKFGATNRRIGELQTALSRAALKSDVAKIVAETQTIVDLTNRVKVVEGKVEKLELAVNHHTTGLAAVGGQAQTAFNMAKTSSEKVDGLAKHLGKLWIAIAVLGLISVLAIIFSLVALSRRGGAAKTAAAPGQFGDHLRSRITPVFTPGPEVA
ncbi:hypothetical protein A3I99_02190 [Candidatus Kaiserbacteria bacterium RIFCSPLOWO2_02_FULL_45_11b]|uniref:SLH domain-containing protein n=1 Tax=Candidatus Kaiserbacteria bacterium RIFCSPLOWO2_12_FULL_45_26 TaxID=1798525 RepID=A0A1F6FHS4_9BACT|nr:MAG: hypothetical protein A2929_03935 [Candidatus Kaiserbacteria bacterium RIFCSPLOWO2_01_FULL_45_25]OGG81872.1 MAG: hypothetical protein A3I99_02190 [Candidatus Kaiserbacteria bacterium RIFCSPLOWO2_02_FULL_45_11b]OGG85376.1 MAG: hypothetical protein A3G90_04995 [Candidatus Kaiserbacteria bacterium RIFCSPLOWO2_12_FULL_45_26]